MYLALILSLVGLAGLLVIAIHKEKSFLYILALIASCVVAFGVAYALAQPLVLFILIVPISVYVSWLARDELHVGRPWLYALIGLSLVISCIFLYRTTTVVAQASGLVGVGALVALLLSYRPSWVKKRGTWESRV